MTGGQDWANEHIDSNWKAPMIDDERYGSTLYRETQPPTRRDVSAAIVSCCAFMCLVILLTLGVAEAVRLLMENCK